MPQNDLRKTFKSNQFRHENVVPNEMMTVEFRGNDPTDLADNPMRMWARTDTGDLFYTVDGVNKFTTANRFDLGYFNVKWFGAKGDGVTDDTLAFRSAFQYAANNTVNIPSLSSNRFGNVSIYVPPGTYKITDYIMVNPSNRTGGLIFEGAGRSITRIVYNPTNPTIPLMTNADRWLGLKFENLSFFGTADASFMLSDSDGGAQNYTFFHCQWNNWNKVLELTGSNTNSEMTWYHCNFNGVIKKALYVGTADTSDQFLNYTFFGCNYEVSEGNFIDMAKGGNINVIGGSFIHIGATAGTFFNLIGNVHSRGVTRILVSGIRVEHRGFANSKLIYSEWQDGNITFESVDCSANEDGTADNQIRAVFVNTNSAGPIINFRDARLAGIHQYSFAISTWNNIRSIKYEGCTLEAVDNGENIDSFITVINTAGNAGGTPPIIFDNCRWSQNGSVIPVNTVYNMRLARGAVTSRKIATMKNATGQIMSSPNVETITLPIGSIITQVRCFLEPGKTVSTSSGTLTLTTQEGVPTTLATLNLTQFNLGFNVSADVWFVCDTLGKAALTLTPSTGVNVALAGYVFVEYI